MTEDSPSKFILWKNFDREIPHRQLSIFRYSPIGSGRVDEFVTFGRGGRECQFSHRRSTALCWLRQPS